MVTRRSDGAFDVTATISRRTNQSEFHFRCIASGLAVNGTAERTVIVQIIKPVKESLPGGYIFLILLLFVATSAFLVLVVFRVWKYHKFHTQPDCPIDNQASVESQENANSRTRRGFKLIMTKDCFCWVFGCKNQKDRTHDNGEEQPLNEEETELGNLRKKLTSYKPGNPTGMANVNIPDSSIHIGLFGVMGAGKSSFINSLHFALRNEYKDVAIEAGDTSAGSQTKFRETVELTEHIHIVDNRGMKDFKKKQIEEDLMPQIRGERGLEPKKKVKKGTGKQIHCPVFVCNPSQPIKHDDTLDFIRQFSDKVYDHFGNVNATDQVPDNQVWTPATATFFYGQPKANISCKFLGTPYGVYWMKGSSPATADTLLSLTKGEVSGPKFDDGSLTITEDYSLVFNNVQAGDEGNYICRVSNHNGYLFNNNTDVMVLDPAQVSIFTEPSITGWAGHSVNLQCAFRGTPERVLWNRVQGEPESKSVETVLRYTSDGYEVLGDRRYSWSDNYGLIIRDLRILDEGNFTCTVSKTGGTEIQNTTALAVYARAEKPYIQIAQCKSQPEIATNGTTPESCQYNVTENKDSFELQCSVIRAKPRVDILWQEESQNLTASQIVTRRSDGAFDVTATISRRTNQSDQFNFRCIASGLAVNGTAERTVIVEIIKPVQGSLSGSLSGGHIFLILLLIVVISAFLIFVVCRGWKYHKLQSKTDAGTRRGFKWIMTRDCVCWVFGRKKQEDKTHDIVEIQPLNSEEDSELKVLREKLISYRPGKTTGMTGVDIPDSSLHIGLFGFMGAEKSSFINSLYFALTNEYKDVAIEADSTAAGSETKVRAVELTEHIHIVDNRGMKDFSSKQIKKDLMPQIRGERELESGKEVKNGKQTHCPVFVCNLRQPVKHDDTLNFIRKFSDKVTKHCGRSAVVVVTHEGKLNGPAEADGSLEDVVHLIEDKGGVPRNSIWTFENYTEDCHAHDAMKSIEYLKFLSTCLEIGEINIKFRLLTEAEQQKKKKKSIF